LGSARTWRAVVGNSANDFFLLEEEDFGEAPKSAREGACAPQKKRVIAHISFVMSSEVETSLDSVSLKNS
jgi:hypothetical protein